ncbi:transglutaminase-like cysteine peptidase [Enterovirga rhinocerotis]|uniref:Putative transglutaminase-like cysteine proteinase n=1 Tax=Enterovirga rhinocerotis TaxID=1339210 RepID=A0A4R7C6R6_9HYPH|nr:transglutaminase-like cysteine peptidase [Enterovirga rhinocerotis]TDR93833.1 putative transglutaminase-like cysteine proteinase [Enterovirga rhinocerotis]
MKTIEGSRVSKILAAAAFLLAGLWIAAPSVAEAQTFAALPKSGTVGRLDVTGSARPVRAWVSYCERYAGGCDVDTSEPAIVTLNPRLWRALNTVNRHVNATIKPMTDQDHWGVVDRWDLPTDGAGDCEDIQLLKRKLLVEKHGVPNRALRMTVVIDEQGEGHAVLMVRTNEGELILDNKRDAVLAWHQTGYVFVKREGQDSRQWVSLGDLSSPITTANR